MLSIGAVVENTSGGVQFQNAETVVFTLSPVLIPKDSLQILLLVSAQVTIGAGTTQITWRVRRGLTTADTNLFNYIVNPVTPGNVMGLSFMCIDLPIGAGVVSYALTGQGTGSTTNTTTTDLVLAAIFLQ